MTAQFFTVLSFTSLVALASASVSMAATAPLNSQKATATTAKKKTTGWITAPSKKGGSGVVVRYKIEGQAAVGKALQVTLSFSSINSEAGATVSLKTEGTSLKIDKPLATAQKLANRQATSMPLSVTPQAEGTFYLSVVTEQDGRSSVTMIPIRVGHGKVAMKPAGNVVTTPEGEKIISMPAK
jgi:hypothetical protein